MDAHYCRVSKPKSKTKLKRKCTLCNEPNIKAHEQIKHFTSAIHKYMKQIKQKQHSYTKNFKTLDEKINASEEQEPLIGLEYIYQYAADKRGVVPYACMQCNRIFKISTIFFHITGIKHRSLYLGTNFPVLGIDCNFKPRTPSEFRKLLSAAEIIEKNYGRKKINVFNSSFNPKKIDGMKSDSGSEEEGLSSSEDEQDNPYLTPTNSTTATSKTLYADELATLGSGVGDLNKRPVNHSDKLPSQHDHKGGLSLPNVGKGSPAFRYDNRQGPELHDDHSNMLHSLRNPGDSSFQHDSWSDRSIHENIDNLRMELAYQQRGPDSRNVPGRTDLFGDRNTDSQMHRDGIAFQFDDRQGSVLQSGPKHTDIQLRNNNRDFAFQPDQSARSLGNPRGDLDMPSMRPLSQQIDYDRNFQSQVNRGGTAFQFDDRQGATLDGGPRHPDKQERDNSFGFQVSQSARSLGNPQDDRDMPSMGPLRQQIDPKDVERRQRTQSHPPGFYGARDLSSQMHRDAMAFLYREHDFAFKHDQSKGLLGNPRGDLDMPSVGPLHQQDDQGGVKGQNKTQRHPPSFHGDHSLTSQTHRDGMSFQFDDRQGSRLHSGPRDTDNQLRNSDRDFSFQNNENTQLSHGDHKMSSMGPLHQQADRDDIKFQSRTQNHPPSLFGDRNLQTQKHRDGMVFNYDDRRGPMLQSDSRHTDDRVGKNDHDFAFRHGQSTQSLGSTHGDFNAPSLKPLHQQVNTDDANGHKRTQSHPSGFSGDRDLKSQIHRGGAAFWYDDAKGAVPQGGPSRTDNPLDKERASSFQLDNKREDPFPNVRGDLGVPSMKSFSQQGDRHAFKERSSTENCRPGFSADHKLKPQGEHGGGDIRHLRRGVATTFKELREIHESKVGNRNVDEEGGNDDSDMEVRSMDLSDCEQNEFLCKADIFQFLETFKVVNCEDEQFATKVKDLFANSSIRYKTHREDVLKRRIAEEKAKLAEEKKAFLEIQKSMERSKLSSTNKNQAPGSSSRAKPPFPVAASNNKGLAKKPTPLMSVMAESSHPPEPESRWARESIQRPSEMHLGDWTNQPPRRGAPIPSRGPSDSTRDLQSGYPTRKGSVNY